MNNTNKIVGQAKATRKAKTSGDGGGPTAIASPEVTSKIRSFFARRSWVGSPAQIVTLSMVVIGAVGGLARLVIQWELVRALDEEKRAFARQSEVLFTHEQLLGLLSSDFVSAQERLQFRVVRLTQGVREYAERHPLPTSGSDVDPMRSLVAALIALESRINWNDPNALGKLGDLGRAEVSIAKLRVIDPEYITEESRLSSSPTKATMARDPHPVQDGTIAGAMQDIRLRIVELEAFRRMLEKLREDLIKLNGKTPVEAGANIDFVSLRNAAFASYQQNRAAIAADLLVDKSDLDTYAKHVALYSFDRLRAPD